MSGAFRQMATPGPDAAALYRSDPRLAHAVVDVAPRVTWLLQATLTGMLAQPGAALRCVGDARGDRGTVSSEGLVRGLARVEDRPPDLGPPLRFLAGFVKADRVVLADRPFDREGVVGDVGSE